MKKMIKFGDIEIEKQTFHQHKESISIKNINTNKITVSNKDSLIKMDLNLLLATRMLKNRHLCIL